MTNTAISAGAGQEIKASPAFAAAMFNYSDETKEY
jgi:hypothetical protein